MKFSDEEIQIILDPKSNSGEYTKSELSHEDTEVYEMLMNHLEQPPEINIPLDFAENVTVKAVRERARLEFARKILLYLFVSLPLIAAGLMVIYFMAPGILQKFVAFVGSNMPAVIFSVIILSTIQLLDNLLIRNKLKGARQ